VSARAGRNHREVTMKKRRIGRSDLHVVPLCFGGNVFGWTADESMSFRLLDAFVDAGFDFIDTADVYSIFVPGHTGGESETVIGKWLKKSGKRDKIVLATKVGMQMAPDKTGLKPDYVLRAVEDSLRRLQTDRIDLYQSHADDESVAIEETLRTYDSLIKAGKVRVIGASNFSGARLREALDIAERTGLPRYECLQPHYNLVERKDFERDLGPLCRDREVGVIPYFSLAAGFLTGKYRSEADLAKSVRGPRTAGKYLNEHGHRVLGALDAVANAHRASLAQVALAWLIAKPGLTAPIASATTPEQLHELLGAVSLTLSEADMAKLDAASA
jgi:aryl-alcohol dehydrogenase-like predicted oxidoreductase